LVPAHDEEQLVARCVTSLIDQTYPGRLYRVFVVADNCSDGTAMAARAAGAAVIERFQPEAPGKGRALRWAMDQLLESEPMPDAVVVVDADSVADRGLLEKLAAAHDAGSEVVQAEYLVLRDDASLRSELASAAFLLFHRVRLSGRAALHMPTNLVGNGMLFSRRLLERHPWDAFSAVEDLEYSLNLRLAGIRPAFAATARVYGPLPKGGRGTTNQRVRWEGGRWHLVRTYLWPLLLAAVRQRRPDLLDAVLDLAVPPLGLLLVASWTGLALAVAATFLGAAAPWTTLPWAIAAACVPAFVLIGLRSARAPRSAFSALLGAPGFLASKLLVYVRILRGFDPQRWERSEGSSELLTRDAGSVDVAGVRVDAIDLGGALDRIEQALDADRLFQVSTVNLDFLVRAQRSREIRAVFERSSLNVADGTPVVWLGRLLGKPVPERVAGADLVPRLMGRVGARGVFLLGGENGAAAEAARRLQAANPGLVVAGCIEPPRCAIEDMDNEAILTQISESGAKVLLVALGHPKQDLWIDRHRDRLNVSVAIGVGCVFDLIAGRMRRAPVWMQRAGLEWLHRLLQEPGRLLGRYTADFSWLMLITFRILLQRVHLRAA
jgi:exopolysaccharide biosynthesis WecB/TagA/CpsF family protein